MRGFRRCVGSRVVLVSDDIRVRGRVGAVFGGVLLLREVDAIDDTVGVTRVDGELLVPVARVAYVQVIE